MFKKKYIPPYHHTTKEWLKFRRENKHEGITMREAIILADLLKEDKIFGRVAKEVLACENK